MSCPCGSKVTFSECCLPLINGDCIANTAEQLMRSRYSAYASRKYQYIVDTYAYAQQQKINVDDIKESANEQKWVKLVIHRTQESAMPAEVEFSAYYLIDDNLYELRENSKFVKEAGMYRYVDGEIMVSDKVKSIKRNDSCPCDSGKKFKKCCGA